MFALKLKYIWQFIVKLLQFYAQIPFSNLITKFHKEIDLQLQCYYTLIILYATFIFLS
jgi:hypothetical protein